MTNMRKKALKIFGWLVLAVLCCAGMTVPAMAQEDAGSQCVYQDGTLTFSQGEEVISLRWENEIPRESVQVVIFPASAREIDGSVVGQLREAREFHVAAENPYFSAIDGVLFSKDGKELVLFPPGRGGSYTIPQRVEAVAKNAFERNVYLEELVIGDSVTSAEFVHGLLCYGEWEQPPLKKIVLSASVTQAKGVWLKGDWLERVEVAEGNPSFYSEDGVLFSRDGTLLLYPAMRMAEHYDVPPGVKRIGPSSFQETGALRSVSLPKSVVAIESHGFSGCSYLQGVSLPLGLESIGEYAFGDCVHLERMVVPGKTVVSDTAFYNCPLLGSALEGDPFVWDADYGYDSRPFGIISPENAGDMVAVYAEPSAKANVLLRTPGSSVVQVVGQQAGFYQVTATRESTNIGEVVGGYVAVESIQICGPLQALFQPVSGIAGEWAKQTERYGDPRLWPKGQPSTWLIPPGKAVKLEKALGPWYFAGDFSWGHYFIPANQLKVYAKEIPEGKTYGVVVNGDLRDRLHLRNKPSRGGESLGKFFSGTQVEILGEEGDWYHVRVGWQEGYMMKEFVRLVEVEPEGLDFFAEQSPFGNG